MRNGDAHWVKGDMLYTLSTSRLDQLYHKPFGNARQLVKWQVTPEDLESVRGCLAYSLGLTPED